jgi:hypothetical protein
MHHLRRCTWKGELWCRTITCITPLTRSITSATADNMSIGTATRGSRDPCPRAFRVTCCSPPRPYDSIFTIIRRFITRQWSGSTRNIGRHRARGQTTDTEIETVETTEKAADKCLTESAAGRIGSVRGRDQIPRSQQP